MEQNSKERQNKIAVRVKIHGRVQGVGFRYSTLREAARRKVRGWVRNNGDGSVEVVGEGERESIRSFLKWLEHGPPGAYVRNTEVDQIPYQGVYSDFRVEY